MRLRYILIGLAAVLLAAEAFAEVYRYKDENGVIHFTDNYIEIPAGRQPGVETVLKEEESASPAVRTLTGTDGETDLIEVRVKDKEPGEEERISPLESLGGGKPPQQQFESLIKTKADLDTVYASLASEKEALEKEQEALTTLESIRVHQEKVNLFNKRLADYESERQAFQARADAYNRSVAR